jgi:nucleotide-binding universal stress UspA family protein
MDAPELAKGDAMTILIAYDGSDNADAAIVAAAKLLANEDRDAVIVTVWEPLTAELAIAASFGPVVTDGPELDEESKRDAQAVAEHGAKLAAEQGFNARPVWSADETRIAQTIVDRADEVDAALIVLGARGLTGVRAWLGSVSQHVLQHAHRPVLVIPADKEPRS